MWMGGFLDFCELNERKLHSLWGPAGREAHPEVWTGLPGSNWTQQQATFVT